MSENELQGATEVDAQMPAATSPEQSAVAAAPLAPPEQMSAREPAVADAALTPPEPMSPEQPAVVDAPVASPEAMPAEPSAVVPEAIAPAAPAQGDATDEVDAPEKVKKQRGRPRTKLEELVVGTETKGRVVGLAKFGVFVDIGAITDGLVHITEFTEKRVHRVEDAVQLGDEVEVWIKDVDLNSGRVSLSMRKRAAHPIADLHPGDVVTGTVTSTTKYGVFVDIGAETEGLVHISEMSSGFVEKPSDVVATGAAVEVRVKEVDLTRDRISLSMVGLSNDLGLQAGQGDIGAELRVDADAIPLEPEERMPTVVELALRRALGQMQDESEEPPAVEAPAPAPAAKDSLGELYERMLASYKAEKSQQR
jgi:predicted RNA-binding protein with RPS1 domain